MIKMSTVPLFIPINEIDKYFFNRKNDITKIEYYLDSLEKNISQRLLITGYRGVGKTFLLHKIKQDAKKEYIVTYLDISRVVGIDNNKLTAKSILLELLDAMNESLLENTENNLEKINLEITNFFNKLKIRDYDFNNGTKLAEIPIPSTEENYKKISKFVMEYPQKIVENNEDINGFIIIIDEFQLLKKLEEPESFFWLLRSYNQFQSNVSYVISGSVSHTADVINMINGASGAFGGRMIQIDIKPFTKEETAKYFKERFSEIEFTESGFDKFYEYTRGIPLYLNSFYHILSSDEIYDDKKIEETFIKNMDQILVMWIRIWGSLNTSERMIICSMLPREQSSWKDLESNNDLSTATLNKYLKSLQDKGIIDYYNNSYVLTDLMLKRWLEHEKNIYGYYPY